MEYDLGEVLSLKQLAYNKLRSNIIRGELKPGTRLLEIELSESMKISRGPIREALNMLERDGFTEIMPRKGAVVSETTEEDAAAVWEMRLILEPYAAKHSTAKIPEEKIRNLRVRLQKVVENPDDFDSYLSFDLELHDLFCKYLDNRFMRSTLENIRAHSLRMRWEDEYTPEGVRNPRTMDDVNSEHGTIVDAIISRDENSVFDAVYKHIIQSTKRKMDALKEKKTKEILEI